MNSNVYSIIALLKLKCPEYQSETDHAISQLLLSALPNTLSLKMKLLANVFKTIDKLQPTNLLNQRKAEKVLFSKFLLNQKVELKSNCSNSDKLLHSQVFLDVYSQWIYQELLHLGYSSSGLDAPRIFSGKYFISILDFLLNHTHAKEDVKFNKDKKKDHEKISNSIATNNLKKIRNLAIPIDSSESSIQNIQEKCKLQSQINSLENQLLEQKKINHEISKKYSDLENLYNAAMSDTDSEINKRRAFVLKSQNIQLQRHLSCLQSTLQSREAFDYEVDDDLQKIQDLLGSCMKSKIDPDINKNLKLCSQYLDTLKKQLHRTIRDNLKDNSQDSKTPDFLFISEFTSIPKNCDKKLSIADICSGNIQHLNLKHISRLESQLHTLHESLVNLQASLETCVYLPEISSHFNDVLLKSKTELNSSLNSLLSLCILVPAAPSPDIKQLFQAGWPILPNGSDISNLFPNANGVLRSKIQKMWDQLMHGIQAYLVLVESEMSGHKKELNFHKTLYQNYTQKMIHAVETLEKKSLSLKTQWNELRNPIISIRSQLDSLELNPVSVKQFIENTERELDIWISNTSKSN